jgi:hypothetical protein
MVSIKFCGCEKIWSIKCDKEALSKDHALIGAVFGRTQLELQWGLSTDAGCLVTWTLALLLARWKLALLFIHYIISDNS